MILHSYAPLHLDSPRHAAGRAGGRHLSRLGRDHRRHCCRGFLCLLSAALIACSDATTSSGSAGLDATDQQAIDLARDWIPAGAHVVRRPQLHSTYHASTIILGDDTLDCGVVCRASTIVHEADHMQTGLGCSYESEDSAFLAEIAFRESIGAPTHKVEAKLGKWGPGVPGYECG